MGNLSLTLACGPYDRFEALRNGIVQPEGIDLTYLAIQSPPEIFVRMVKNFSFDIAEMSASMYLLNFRAGRDSLVRNEYDRRKYTLIVKKFFAKISLA
jgi:4,5-dihydroxyphthalate decarboxylase